MEPVGSFSGLASGIQWRDMVDQIMGIERARRVAPLERQQSISKSRSEAWTAYQGLVGKLTSAAKALQDGSAFGKFSVTAGTGTGGRTLFGATAGQEAAPGSYKVEVVSLARAEKLSGKVFAATDTALDAAGELFVNGKRVVLAATDTLVSVRDKINAANSGAERSGVTATILSTGTSEHRLVLTSDATGSRGVELVDDAGGALHKLGLLTAPGASTVANTVTRDATTFTQTQRFGSRTTPLATMLGLQSPPAQRQVQIGGVVINVNLLEDSLDSIQRKVQEKQVLDGLADPKPAINIVEEEVGGRTMYRLEAQGTVAGGADADADTDRMLRLLGFNRAELATGAQISAGADAEVRIDGFSVTRRSNSVSGVLQGITLNLQHAEPGTTVDLTVGRDTGAIVDAVKGFAAAYNEVRSFAERQSAAGQPLASNGTLRSTVSRLTQVLFTEVVGLSASNPYTRGALAGVTLSKTGTLEVDEAALRSALESNYSDVRELFATGGVSSNPQLGYVTGGSKAQAGTYSVEITQAATRASGASTSSGTAGFVGGLYVSADGATADALSITDRSSGKSISYDVAHNADLATVVRELNARFIGEGLRLTASEDAGQLRFTATDYGSPAGVTLSGAAAAQMGFTADATSTVTLAGQDVRGYLYTDAADKGSEITGSGRGLIGAAGTAAEGLELTYKGTDTGVVGTIRFAVGLAGNMARAADVVSRSGDGIVAGQIDSISSSSESLTRRIEDAEARLERRRESMIRQFARMEAAMSRIQSQGNWLSGQIKAMQGTRDR